MKVDIKRAALADERVVIYCESVTREVEEIRSFALTKGSEICGMQDGRSFCIPVKSVCYFEAVDEKTFACTDENVYELRLRLYELEEKYAEHGFVRCSKSMLVSIFAIASISPQLNGRFLAHLRNGEDAVVSRRYVSGIKDAVLRGCGEGRRQNA